MLQINESSAETRKLSDVEFVSEAEYERLKEDGNLRNDILYVTEDVFEGVNIIQHPDGAQTLQFRALKGKIADGDGLMEQLQLAVDTFDDLTAVLTVSDESDAVPAGATD